MQTVKNFGSTYYRSAFHHGYSMIVYKHTTTANTRRLPEFMQMIYCKIQQQIIQKTKAKKSIMGEKISLINCIGNLLRIINRRCVGDLFCDIHNRDQSKFFYMK
jgi:hypothetical protein